MSNCISEYDSKSDIANNIPLENPITNEEKLLLLQLRRLITKHIAEYKQNGNNSEFITKYKIPEIKHWRLNNPNIPEPSEIKPDNNYCCPEPWILGKSCLDVYYPDWLLIRFVRARRDNLQEATRIFVNMCIWRDKYGSNEMALLPSQPYKTRLESYVTSSSWHVDSQGRTIYIEKTGLIKVEAFTKEFNEDEMMLTHIWLQENNARILMQRSIALNKRVDKTIFIFDMQGMGLGHRKLSKFLNLFTAVDTLCYRDTVGASYFINCPKFFYGIWSLVKPFVPKSTVEKVKIFSNNYQPQLNNDLGAIAIPPEYGGTCTCGDCFKKSTTPSY